MRKERLARGLVERKAKCLLLSYAAMSCGSWFNDAMKTEVLDCSCCFLIVGREIITNNIIKRE